jgi:P4 family phage/plasmid primase-like protien
MPTKLDYFLNGRSDGKTDRDRKGRKVTEKDLPFTHWSFENKQKWFISEEDEDEFLKLYCTDIRNCVPQYLTERSTAIGQLRVDMDFKYEGRVEEHKHTKEQVNAFMKAYMSEMKKYLQVPDSVAIYVLEKDYPTYDSIKKISSSGVHIQVPGVKTRASVEQSVRRTLLRRMDEFFPNLECNKGWEDVYDKSPLTHHGNWPMLGSKKVAEGSLPYSIRYVLNWDSETGEIQEDEDTPISFSLDLVKKLSVRSPASDETPLTEFGEANSRPAVEPTNAPSGGGRGRSMTRGDAGGSRASSPGRNYIAPLTETQEAYILAHTKNLAPFRYSSYSDWIPVGQCLKNIHPDLEEVWLTFSAQFPEWDSKKENEARAKWNSFGFRVDGERLGIGSLRHWSKTDNFDGYVKIEASNVDTLVDEAAKTATEYDVAQVIFAKYRDEFKCANFKSNDWYHYIGHIWRNTDNGVELQRRLSSDIVKLFRDKEQLELNNIANVGECGHKDTDPSCESCMAEKRKKEFSSIRLKLKTTRFKDNVMKECRVLFFDSEFAAKLDDNKHLIAFNNGVFDTLTQTFRDGRSEDYISFCTKIDYAIDTKYYEFACWKELEKFLHSILPNRNVREYFLNHLSTCLSGVFNQRFHILTGSGSNGKSMLMNLAATCFGEYCYKANIAMFTQKRGKAGSASPELVRMKGKRFVMMSEPDEGEALSSGFMKEITSSEKISGRDLYAGSKQMVEFDVQAKCHLACNDKPKVNTNDGGTWRRLKVIDFPSKFVHEPKAPNELPMDESIMHKVLSQEWAECFMSYLIHLYTVGKGLHKLNPPNEVEAYTSEYKEDSDSIAKFMAEMFHPLDGGEMPGEYPETVSWTTIMATFQEWKRGNEVSKGGVQDLRKRIESTYGKMPKNGWTAFRFGAA